MTPETDAFAGAIIEQHGTADGPTLGRMLATMYRLERQRDEARAALQEIIDPISAMQRQLKPDEILNGAMAVQLSRDPEYLRAIARAGLEAKP